MFSCPEPYRDYHVQNHTQKKKVFFLGLLITKTIKFF